MLKILIIGIVISMILITTTACSIGREKSSVEFNNINLKEKLTSMEKAINQKDEEQLNKITRNISSTRKLLEDFPSGKLLIKEISSYMLTENIIHVQIKIDAMYDTEISEYVILIENKREGWEIYPSGFINK
ncbi:MAG: hypothetical protein PHQ32_06560 [Firmicutes bacterium]|nr:hypothetical protein [Bacillota bacterium]